MFQKKCSDCAIYIPQAQTCQIMGPLMQGKIKPTDYCSHHKDREQIYVCEGCGQAMIDPIISVTDDAVHIYCPDCIIRIH